MTQPAFRAPLNIRPAEDAEAVLLASIREDMERRTPASLLVDLTLLERQAVVIQQSLALLSEAFNSLQPALAEAIRRHTVLPPRRPFKASVPGLWGQAMSYVAAVYELSEDDLLGRNRKGLVSEARQLLMWLGVQGGLSTTRVGALLGRRHHTTVIDGVHRTGLRRARDPAFRALSDEIMAKLPRQQIPPAERTTSDLFNRHIPDRRSNLDE